MFLPRVFCHRAARYMSFIEAPPQGPRSAPVWVVRTQA
jgi:hypothetical protein